MPTFQSRWGFHPCDYETFRLLKALHKRYWQAVRQVAAWQRWNRKLPRNRVVRQWLRDTAGRKIASRIVGPHPEPPLCPLFCRKEKVLRHFTPEGQLVREGVLVDQVTLHDPGILLAYREARRPKASPDQVQPLSLSVEEIRGLAQALPERMPTQVKK